MDKSVTNNYIEKFQKYKKLYEEIENFSEKTAYEKICFLSKSSY